MIYREYLVMRKALAWYAAALLALVLILVALGARASAPGVNLGSGGLGGVELNAGWPADLFAAIFGVALGNGSRSAARVLWVLPVLRWKLALQVVSVDLAGITVAYAFALLAVLLWLALSGLHFSAAMFATISVRTVVMALATGYATYGWSALIGVLGRRMSYAGLLVIPVLGFWITIAQTNNAFGVLLRRLSIADPYAVVSTGIVLGNWNHRGALDILTASLQWLGTTWEIPVLLAIAAVTCGLTALLWQRAHVISA